MSNLIATYHPAPTFDSVDEAPPIGSGGRSVRAADPQRANELVVLDKCAFTRECAARVLKSIYGASRILAFSCAQDLVESYRGSDVVPLILFNIGESRTGDPQIRGVLEFLRSNLSGCAVVVVSDSENRDHVIEAIGSGVRGYIPPSTSLDVAVEALRLVEAGGTYVPASSLRPTREMSVGDARSAEQRKLQQFTPQQVAILQRIAKGKPNKIIAHELVISESTVKVHVRNIMRKLKATNRTEVAFRTRDICSALAITNVVPIMKIATFLMA